MSGARSGPPDAHVRLGDRGDVGDLARLLWHLSPPDERAAQPVSDLARDLDRWWAPRLDAHVAFVARRAGHGAVGAVWLALVPRVPRPGAARRVSGDLQSLFVEPEHRGLGIGTALVAAAADHARHLGAVPVTVHANDAALPLYERAGFRASRHVLRRT